MSKTIEPTTSSTPYLALHQVIEDARRQLPDDVWNYLTGAADSETTLHRERQAFDRWAWVPRIMRDVTEVDLGTTLLGRSLRLPILLAGMGSIGRLHPDALSAAARAASATGIALGVSSVIPTFLDTAAKAAPEAMRIYQLYVDGDSSWLHDEASRALESGYHALSITADLPVFSRRERDIVGNGASRANSEQPGNPHRASFTWDKLQRLRDNFGGKLILKGVISPKDADTACRIGVDAVNVSTHGGRQLDHCIASLQALPAVVTTVDKRAEVWVDGGFCRGSDILKALALGADAVGIGRLYGYGLAADGESGVSRVVQLLEREMRITMALIGATSLADLSQDFLQPSEALHRAPALPHAFPLITLS